MPPASSTSRTPLPWTPAGRVFVGDRSNSRIQIFEPDGTFVAEWKQFGRPSGMFIDEDDVLYVTDSTSNSRNNPGFRRGIYIGSAVDGTVRAYIPDPDVEFQDERRISGASGITADRQGNVYAGRRRARNGFGNTSSSRGRRHGLLVGSRLPRGATGSARRIEAMFP